MELYELIRNYSDSNPLRFHTPGHAGKDIGIDTGMDVTELSFSDNLHEADGAIRECETRIAKACGAKYALMLTSGGTGGIAAAVYLASQRGKTLIIAGSAHKSVYNYAALTGMKTLRIDENAPDFPLRDVGGIVVTSPDYFGCVKDLKRWKRPGVLLIQDSAHGAHFPFSDLLPDTAVSTADITVTSWHKTLPVLTGGAALYCNEESVYRELLRARAVLHTTSPSYMVMCSMDRACKIMDTDGRQLYQDCIRRINEFKSALKDGYAPVRSDDPTRVVISIQGRDAAELAGRLEERNVYVEMHALDRIVMIVTPYNCANLAKLAEILNEIDLNALRACPRPFPKAVCSVAPGGKETQIIDIADSVGRVAADEIGTYPPGIPQLLSGEVVSEEIRDYLIGHISELFGLIGGKIRVYKEGE